MQLNSITDNESPTSSTNQTDPLLDALAIRIATLAAELDKVRQAWEARWTELHVEVEHAR